MVKSPFGLDTMGLRVLFQYWHPDMGATIIASPKKESGVVPRNSDTTPLSFLPKKVISLQLQEKLCGIPS